MARPNPTTGRNGPTSRPCPDFADLVTYKLRSWNELYGVQSKRYYHAGDVGVRTRQVEIAPDLRIACRCGQYSRNLQTGAGPCEHVADAIDYIEAVGYNRLASWPVKS